MQCIILLLSLVIILYLLPTAAFSAQPPTEILITNQFFQEEATSLEHAMRQVVLANRILANEDVIDVYGHVSLRNPLDPNVFIISRAMAPRFVNMEDILIVNLDGKTIWAANGNLNQQAFGERFIHCALYKTRPEVISVAHAHPVALFPFLSSNASFGSVTFPDFTFYDGLPMFGDQPGDVPPEVAMLINRSDLAEKMVDRMGNKRGLLLRNHGMVVVGESIPRVVFSSIGMVNNAKVLIQILSMGMDPIYIDTETQMYGTLRQFSGNGMARSWDYWSRKARVAYEEIAHLEHNQ